MSWRTITHNLGWKLGSLLAAILLWFSIVGEPEVVISRSSTKARTATGRAATLRS